MAKLFSHIDVVMVFWGAAATLFLYLCAYIGRDINKISNISTDLALLKSDMEKIAHDVHEIKSQEKGVLSAMMDCVKELMEESAKERHQFANMIHGKFKEYDQKIILITNRQKRFYKNV